MAGPYAEVIGDPIEQSKSPLIHNYWLQQLGLPGDYRRTRVAADELGDYLDQRRADPNWRGCNVTVPHKESVIPHLDGLDAQARAIGAVNCVVRSPEGLVGGNTDVDGVAAALDRLPLSGAKAALIGAGGGARAALAYLARRRIRELAILVRSPERAEPLRALVPLAQVQIGAFDQAARLFAGAAAIINASPLGMVGCAPMPDRLLAAAEDSGATLFDMVYKPLATPLLATAPDRAVNGLTMLVGQAARAFEGFFGQSAPPPDQTLFDLLARES